MFCIPFMLFKFFPEIFSSCSFHHSVISQPLSLENLPLMFYTIFFSDCFPSANHPFCALSLSLYHGCESLLVNFFFLRGTLSSTPFQSSLTNLLRKFLSHLWSNPGYPSSVHHKISQYPVLSNS